MKINLSFVAASAGLLTVSSSVKIEMSVPALVMKAFSPLITQ